MTHRETACTTLAVTVIAFVLLAGCSASSSTPTAVASTAPPGGTATPEASVTSATALAPTAASPYATPSPRGPASPSPTAGPAGCATTQLSLSLGQQQGAAGTDYQTLVLTNTGLSCRLRGFPGVSLLRADGGQVGASAAATGPRGAQVLLAPRSSAYAVLSIANAGNYPPADCRPQPATRIRVYPPGQTTPLTAAASVQACSAPGVRQLRVTAVRAGDGPPS